MPNSIHLHFNESIRQTVSLYNSTKVINTAQSMESLKFVDAFGRKCPGLNTSFYTFRGSFFQILHFYLFVLL